MSRIVLSDRLVLQSYPKSSRLEWLEANGAGAFATGTVAGANTKRTHGHLIAPDGQQVIAKFEEHLLLNGHRTGLSVNAYPGQLNPAGHEYLEQFRLDPYPVWRYRVDDIVVERSLWLVPGHTTLVMEWRLVAGAKCWLEVRPLYARRGLDELQRSAPLPPIEPTMHHSPARVFAEGYWYFHFVYDTGQEDLYSPGVYQFRLEPGQSAWMVVTSESGAVTGEQVEAWRAERRARRSEPADDFVLGLREIRTSYPHDRRSLEEELIALPGILLANRREGEARRVLTRALAAEEPSLWLFPALMEYQRRAGEDAFLAETAYPALGDLLERWRSRCDGLTGLLPGTVGENALWINALLIHNMLAGAFGRPLAERRRFQHVLRQALAHYEAAYWPTGRAQELDPEQLLAVSLPFVCVEEPLQRSIVDALSLTPLAQTWMLAHYFTAYLRVHLYAPPAVEHCRRELALVEQERQEHCLGHLPYQGEAASAVRLGEYLRAKVLLAAL